MSSGINISFTTSEQAKFRRWTKSLDEQTTKSVQSLVISTILNIARRSQMFLSSSLAKPTSFLATSIHHLLDSDKLGGAVYTNRNYAPYVEFGTGDLVQVSDDTKEYAMEFKGKGIRKVNLRARPYLFPAVRLSMKEMFAKLETMGFRKT